MRGSCWDGEEYYHSTNTNDKTSTSSIGSVVVVLVGESSCHDEGEGGSSARASEEVLLAEST